MNRFVLVRTKRKLPIIHQMFNEVNNNICLSIGDEHPGQKQRKGFFRSFWKKSRHYSLEHP